MPLAVECTLGTNGLRQAEPKVRGARIAERPSSRANARDAREGLLLRARADAAATDQRGTLLDGDQALRGCRAPAVPYRRLRAAPVAVLTPRSPTSSPLTSLPPPARAQEYTDARVLVGNWFDTRKQPDFASTRPEARTEQQEAAARRLAAEGAGSLPVYGATLESQNPLKSKFERKIDYANVIYYRTDCTPAGFESVNKTVHFGAGGPTSLSARGGGELASGAAAPGHALPRDPAALAEYRARWLNEADPRNRVARYTTVMAASGGAGAGVPARFLASNAQRFLPGAVKALDALRERLLERHGVDGVAVLAASFAAARDEAAAAGMLAGGGAGGRSGGASMSILPGKAHLAVADPRGFTPLALRAHLDLAIGVHLSVDDETLLFRRFLDEYGSGRASPDALVGGLLQHGLPPARAAAVDRAWRELEELVALAARNVASAARAAERGGASAGASAGAGAAAAGHHAGAGGVTFGVARRAFDASFHPDVRRKPLPLRSPAAATARLVAGLAAAARDAGALGGGLAESLELSRAVAGVLGAVPPVPGEDAIAAHSPALYGLLDGAPLARPAWDAYAAMLSAAVDEDDPFTRLYDGCFHVAAKPAFAALAPAHRESAPRRVDGGLKTAMAEVGAGLTLGARPYTGADCPLPRVPPSKLDLDAVVAATGGDTHVALLVTHADGRKSVQRLVVDRFLDVNDAPALLARLAQAGVSDAIDCAVDF